MKISNKKTATETDAIADFTISAIDQLKDQDAGIWAIGLPEEIQASWKKCCAWIRWVDHLAERDQLLQPGGQQFPAFYAAWQRLKQTGTLAEHDQGWPVLRQIAATWFRDPESAQHGAEIRAWDSYMTAMVEYHRPTLTLATLHDYEVMLERLSGSCFRFMPFLKAEQRAIAGQFGMVDQFYNNLRDLYEDVRRGLCYFPRETLEQFGLTQEAILNQTCWQDPAYFRLMNFWVNEYLPDLRQRNLGLILETDLHPTWRCLTAWFVHRYMRVEQVLRRCNYDVAAFETQYWQVVKQELQQQRQMLLSARYLEPPASFKLSDMARFLNVQPTALGIWQSCPVTISAAWS